ncbi:hypothetical protein JYU34_001628 [Plutella xylostella]|uniref:Uncharacterized protein n=1 Tax=Plutella xylostella TaxID=51655 RepID=A0ABQ7R4E8_PLUXY|nr:hypothetical protein JYU34_001628 [Plutella xylostella]
MMDTREHINEERDDISPSHSHIPPAEGAGPACERPVVFCILSMKGQSGGGH